MAGERIVFASVLKRQVQPQGLVSELELTPQDDGVPTACVVNFDNLHTLPKSAFSRLVAELTRLRIAESCAVLRDGLLANLPRAWEPDAVAGVTWGLPPLPAGRGSLRRGSPNTKMPRLKRS